MKDESQIPIWVDDIMSFLIEKTISNVNSYRYPISAGIVQNEKLISYCIGKAKNELDPTAHPERIVITSASKKLRSRKLLNCYLVSTFEPCPMCTSASIWARLDGIYYGASQEDAKNHIQSGDPKGRSWRQIKIRSHEIAKHANPQIKIYGGIKKEECKKLFSL